MYNYIKKWKGDAKKMLLNFKMENFRSFKDETFFTMLSSKQKTHNDYVIDKSVNGNKLRVLPMTVIYGANASGKSNIIKVCDFIKSFITYTPLNKAEQIQIVPFLLNKTSSRQLSEYSISFYLKSSSLCLFCSFRQVARSKGKSDLLSKSTACYYI